MLFCFLVPAFAFCGMIAHYIIECILSWNDAYKSTCNDILLANSFTPSVLLCYITSLIGARLYTNETTKTICFISTVVVVLFFILTSFENGIKKYRIEGKKPDYAGVVGLCILGIIFVFTNYLFLFAL